MKRFLLYLAILLSIPTLLIPKDDNRNIADPPCYLTMRIEEPSDDSHLMPVGRHIQKQVHARNLTLRIDIPQSDPLVLAPAEVPVPLPAAASRYGLPADIQYRRIRPPISSTSQI